MPCDKMFEIVSAQNWNKDAMGLFDTEWAVSNRFICPAALCLESFLLYTRMAARAYIDYFIIT